MRMIVDIAEKKIANPKEVRAFFEGLQDGKHLLVAKDFSVRSNNQNNYYWTVCELLVVPLRDLGWDVDKDGVHEFLKDRFLKEKVYNEQTQTFFYRIKSTSKLSITEMKNYLDQCIQFAAEIGVYVPEP